MYWRLLWGGGKLDRRRRIAAGEGRVPAVHRVEVVVSAVDNDPRPRRAERWVRHREVGVGVGQLLGVRGTGEHQRGEAWEQGTHVISRGGRPARRV